MSDQGDYRDLRREYCARGLRAAELEAEPVAQFNRWLQEALAVAGDDAMAMVLATASADACPAARIVLLKHFDAQGFCWYTDYRSQKGRELAENPQAELLFYWRGLERQVRIWGAVETLPREEAQAYFQQRPLGSRLSAAASRQSSVVASRDELERAVQALSDAWPEGNVPCPDAWGGYRLKPERFEFWQGRENRLHDRFCYSRQLSSWQVVRLAP